MKLEMCKCKHQPIRASLILNKLHYPSAPTYFFRNSNPLKPISIVFWAPWSSSINTTELCWCLPDEVLLALFLVSSISSGKYPFWLLFSAAALWIQHYVNQINANVVDLVFGAGQVMYSGFIRIYSLKTAALLLKSVRLNQNSAFLTQGSLSNCFQSFQLSSSTDGVCLDQLTVMMFWCFKHCWGGLAPI